jgi:hypothetical protein
MFQSKILRFQNKYGLKLIEGHVTSSPLMTASKKALPNKTQEKYNGSPKEVEIENTTEGGYDMRMLKNEPSVERTNGEDADGKIENKAAIPDP